jgi:hypothetical protein
MEDSHLEQPPFARRRFFKKMAAAGFAVPVVASFQLDSLAFANPRHHDHHRHDHRFPNQAHGNQTYPNQGYGNQTYPNQGYGNQTYPNQSCANQHHPHQTYPNQSGGGLRAGLPRFGA